MSTKKIKIKTKKISDLYNSRFRYNHEKYPDFNEYESPYELVSDITNKLISQNEDYVVVDIATKNIMSCDEYEELVLSDSDYIKETDEYVYINDHTKKEITFTKNEMFDVAVMKTLGFELKEYQEERLARYYNN